jgi:hypothetical protein
MFGLLSKLIQFQPLKQSLIETFKLALNFFNVFIIHNPFIYHVIVKIMSGGSFVLWQYSCWN